MFTQDSHAECMCAQGPCHPPAGFTLIPCQSHLIINLSRHIRSRWNVYQSLRAAAGELPLSFAQRNVAGADVSAAVVVEMDWD